MPLDNFNRLNLTVDADTLDDIETSLSVLLRSCGACSLLIQKSKCGGGD